MNKKLLFLLVLAIPTVVSAGFLGIKKSSEYVSFSLNVPLDSAGIQVKPDSVHVFTYADNASAATFTTRSTTYPFSDISIDTVKIYGDTVYVFADQIQDIDGAGGNFSLAILVRMWTRGKFYGDTREVVQVINDSLNLYAMNTQRIYDSISVYDNAGAGRVARVGDTSNMAGQYTKIGDTSASKTWATALASKTVTLPDSLSAIVTVVNKLDDSLYAALDTLQNASSTLRRDSVYLKTGEATKIADTVSSKAWAAIASGATTTPTAIFSSIIRAQSMRRDTIRQVVYDQLLIPTGGDDQVTSGRFNRIYSRALNAISTSCPAYEKLDTIIMVDDSEGVALAADFVAIKSVQKILGTGQRIPLQVVPYDDTMYNLLGGTAEKTKMNKTLAEQPRYYSAFAGKLFLWPKYAKVTESDSFFVEYYAQVPDVVSDTISTLLSQNYREALIAYCCAMVSQLRHDYQTGSYYFNRYLEEIRRRGVISGNNVQAAGGFKDLQSPKEVPN